METEVTEVVVVQTVRSPIGRKNGGLSTVHPADVLGPVQLEALRRANVDPSTIDQVIGGCINKIGAQAMNITRTAWLSHGGPQEVPCTTVDSQCGSSQYAFNLGVDAIRSGAASAVLASGVEVLSKLPIGSDASAGAAAGLGKPLSRSYYNYFEFTSQFEGAERIAEKYGIAREQADQLGLDSQLRARTAIDEGRFESQKMAFQVEVRNEAGERTGETVAFATDEIPRDTSLELLADLKPVARPDGIHTAGTSSQLADGASAVLLMSAERAESLNLEPLARVVDTSLVGCDPILMLEGPIPVTEQLLSRAGLTMDDIDTVEINEAFASVVLGWAAAVGADMLKVNPNGGAIALGHPLGATGCFLIGKAVHELQRTGGRYGLVTMCCGGGIGTGTLLERI
jgi:acetyl-CoA C-acetyltransferase